MIKIFVAVVCGIVLFLAHEWEPVEAHHGVVQCGSDGLLACLLTTSPFVERVLKPGHDFTWCVDDRGHRYPGFRDQTEIVMQRWADAMRSGQREVTYGSGCDVKHSMRDDHPCSDCGAWVYVGNDPVLIEYNAKAGYSRFDSTIGHETGHGFCLLDEHYDKKGFRSYILTFGRWQHGEPTVMDSGTPYLAAYSPLGIWYPTEYDLARCAETLGRAVGPEPPPITYPYWDGERWVFEDKWSWSPSLDWWFNPNGVAEWMSHGCCGDRWNDVIKRWVMPDGSFYDPATGIRSALP